MTYDVVFYADATPRTGFGHVARSAKLAALLRRNSAGLNVAIQGELTKAACDTVRTIAPEIEILGSDAFIPARLSVIDRMSDTEDPDAWDATQLECIRETSERVCFIASGSREPALPDDVLCIGYQPLETSCVRPLTRWGLEYAPISPAGDRPLRGNRPIAGKARALVALGGAPTLEPVELMMQALAATEAFEHADVLLSPFAKNTAIQLQENTLSVRTHQNIASVDPLIRAADIAIVSYGNLMFEAMSYGIAVFVVGQKDMQAVLAERLARDEMIVNGGLVVAERLAELSAGIRTTLERAPTIAANAAMATRDGGLPRVADLLVAFMNDRMDRVAARHDHAATCP